MPQRSTAIILREPSPPIPKILELINSTARYKVAKGGRGSGKSFGFADVFAHRALAEQARFLCTRDIQLTLKDSALAILKRVILHRKMEAWFKPTKHGLSSKTGSEFIFRGLQNPDRIKSLDGVKYCWVEEAQKVSQEAWDMLVPTIREPGSEIWVNYNPDTDDDPVHKMFVLAKREDAKVVTINHNDNPYFPEVLRAELEWDRKTNYDKYLNVWEGQTRQVTDAQVFRNKFRVDAFETPDDVVFYYGADWGFSQDPTVLLRCFIRNNILWIDQEAYGIGIDIDDTPELFSAVDGAAEWVITADSARPETISYMKQHGYPKIRGAIKGKGSVEDGIEFLKSFEGIMIHPRCKHTIDEFRHYSYKVDRLTGDPLPVLEDKYNHCVVGDTKILTFNGYKKISEIEIGEYVYTRAGFQRVLAKHNNGLRRVKEYRIEDNILECTPDHKIITENGDIEAQFLTQYDMPCIVDMKEYRTCKLKELSIAVLNLDAILNQKTIQIVPITDPKRNILSKVFSIYTDINMNAKLDLYQMVVMFIIKMAIRLIIRLKILGLYLLINLKNIWRKSGHLLRNGIAVRRAVYGIKNMPEKLQYLINGLKKNVHFVVRNILDGLGICKDFAAINVNLHGADKAAPIMSKESALFADKFSQLINTQRTKHAEENVQIVYDLTIENQHEYYANNILIHNCLDSARYAIEKVMMTHKSMGNISSEDLGL